MTKADLVEQVSEAIGPGITKKDCALVVDGFLNAVKHALADGENIEIRGFGTFKVRRFPLEPCRCSSPPSISGPGWPGGGVDAAAAGCTGARARLSHRTPTPASRWREPHALSPMKERPVAKSTASLF
jgi:hypothetical protein